MNGHWASGSISGGVVGRRGSSADRVPIHRPAPVHVRVLSQHVILVPVNENIPLNVFWLYCNVIPS